MGDTWKKRPITHLAFYAAFSFCMPFPSKNSRTNYQKGGAQERKKKRRGVIENVGTSPTVPSPFFFCPCHKIIDQSKEHYSTPKIIIPSSPCPLLLYCPPPSPFFSLKSFNFKRRNHIWIWPRRFKFVNEQWSHLQRTLTG